MAAGDRTLYDDCSSCFQAMSRNMFHLGELFPFYLGSVCNRGQSMPNPLLLSNYLPCMKHLRYAQRLNHFELLAVLWRRMRGIGIQDFN